MSNDLVLAMLQQIQVALERALHCPGDDHHIASEHTCTAELRAALTVAREAANEVEHG